MANAKIMWTQRVAGREEGHVEVVEIDTPFMVGCLKNRRYEILESYAPAPVNETVQVKEFSESELIGLVAKAKPKPAAPKTNKIADEVESAAKGGVEAQGRTWV